MPAYQSRARCPGPCSTAAPINPLNRREFLARTGNGFGLLALLSLLENKAGAREDRSLPASSNPLAAQAPHSPTRAKRCTFPFMPGGPSQIDLFAPKPLLNRLDSQPLPSSFGKIH